MLTHAVSLWIAVAWLTRTAAAKGGNCAAAFKGESCREPVVLPCLGTAFQQPLTLSQEYLGTPISGLNDTAALPAVLALGDLKVDSVSDAISWFPPRPVWGVYHDTAPFSSCAVVGSSPVLTNGQQTRGQEIDAHDLIMRFNNAPTQGYETYVGSKTTLRWENARFSGYRENQTETLLGWYCKPFRSFDAQVVDSTQPRKSFRYDCSDPQQHWPKLLAIMLAKKIHPLNPAFDVWLAEPFRAAGASPSSGMRGFAMLLHVCRHIDVYGMGGSSEWLSWYWDKYPGFQGKPGKKELEAKFPRMGDQHWLVDEWTHADVHRLQPDAIAEALIARRSSRRRSGRRRLLKSSSRAQSRTDKRSAAPAEASQNEALKRGVEDECLAQLERGGLITIHR